MRRKTAKREMLWYRGERKGRQIDEERGRKERGKREKRGVHC